MAIELAKDYILTANTIIFGPLNISGFGDEGAVEYAAAVEDDGEVITGTDGGAVVNWSLDYSATATLSLRETARSYRELGELLRQQRLLIQGGQAPPNYKWVHIDGINGDKIEVAGARIIAGPGLTKTGRFSNRPFKIFLPDAKAQMSYGTLLR